MRKHLYFSGIGGTGLSPLAHFALDCEHTVSGSDLTDNQNTADLRIRGCNISLQQTKDEILLAHAHNPIDQIIITSALPENHPHIIFAKENGIKVSKRNELINEFVKEKNLKLIAIAGTHGKTTTTAIFVWIFKQLHIPISYLVGTNLSFGRSGEFNAHSQYLVYECDEFDRNFLHYHPFLSIIPSLDYDHPDTYPTIKEYIESFVQFLDQSENVVSWQLVKDRISNVLSESNISLERMLGDREFYFLQDDQESNMEYYISPKWINLPGIAMRRNCILVISAIAMFWTHINQDDVFKAIQYFPGTQRRMERIAPNIFSDYAHHPMEVMATSDMATELVTEGKNLVLVYQPHQNIRQHDTGILDAYKHCFQFASKIYWLPTYLSREDPKLAVLTPSEILTTIGEDKNDKFVIAAMDSKLIQNIQSHTKNGDLVVLMGAGDIDEWARMSLVK